MSEPGIPNSVETIMVMETDVLVRMVIADYLRECGYKVVEGANGDDVLTLIGSGIGVNMVISGAQQSGGTESFSLAHRIRISHPDVHVILTSSLERAAQKAAEMCNKGSLTRAYNSQELVKRIQLLRERNRTSI
jgi:DNA-binding response OmpR family regulator